MGVSPHGKKKKKKPREQVDTKVQDFQSVNVTEESPDKVSNGRKKRRKHHDEDQIAEVGTEQEAIERTQVDTPRKKHRKHKRKEEEDRQDSAVTTREESTKQESFESTSEKKRKRKHGTHAEVAEEAVAKPVGQNDSEFNGADSVVTAVDERNDACKEPTKKKRKRKHADIQDTSETASQPLEELAKKKRKKKNKTGFPDPSGDTTLSDQACHALSYAFRQFHDPPSWKFSKARQNWIIRNLWSDKAIPETHVPLVVKYLANVKGGIREELIKACTAVVTPLKDPTVATQPGDPKPDQQVMTEQKSPAPPTDIKQTRARLVLEAMSPTSL